MTTQTPSETKLAELIVATLDLEDVTAADLGPEDSLFGDDLGLDSIDALEIALAVSQEYGVQMKAESEGTREAFANLRTLCAFIEKHQASENTNPV